MLLKENGKKSIRDFKEESEAMRQTLSDSTGSVTDSWRIKMGQKSENERKNTFPFVSTLYTDE